MRQPLSCKHYESFFSFFFLAFFHFYSHTVHVRTRGCRSRASSPHSSRLFYVLRFLIVPENCFSPLFRIFTCLRNSIEFLFDIVVQKKKKNTHTHTNKQKWQMTTTNKISFFFCYRYTHTHVFPWVYSLYTSCFPVSFFLLLLSSVHIKFALCIKKKKMKKTREFCVFFLLSFLKTALFLSLLSSL